MEIMYKLKGDVIEAVLNIRVYDGTTNSCFVLSETPNRRQWPVQQAAVAAATPQRHRSCTICLAGRTG